MKAGLKILVASVGLAVYFFAVVYPFSVKDAFVGNAFVWEDSSARLRYSLLFYPVFWGYLYIVSANILKVGSLRTIVYTVCFAMIFLACHAVILIWGADILWVVLFTVPLGLIGFICLLLLSVKKDIGGGFFFLRKKQTEKIFEQKLLTVVSLTVVPCLLAGSVAVVLSKDEKPPQKADFSLTATAGCEHFSELIGTAQTRVKLKGTDSAREIVKAYQSEFENKDLYGKVELQNDGEFYVYNGKIVWLIFTFEKQGDCTQDSRNCFFSLKYGKEPCRRFVAAEN